MSQSQRLVLLAPMAIGAAWGLGQPFSKIAVTAGWQPFGIIFWQSVIMVAIGGGAVVLRGTGPPKGKAAWTICAVVAFLGTLIPHWASYTAVQVLPAGVMSIVLSTAPMISLPIAVALRLDRVDLRRVAGVALGAAGVSAIAIGSGLGQGPLTLAALAVAGIAPFCYALNGNILDARRRAGLDPMQLVLGAAVLALPASLLMSVVTGQFRVPGFAPGDLAMMTTVVIHVIGYAGLLWVIGRAGAVFASLTNPFVTGFGVLWSMLILAERYPTLIWVGLAFILLGLGLVRPRDRRVLPA